MFYYQLFDSLNTIAAINKKKKKSKPNDNNRPKPSDLNVAIIKLEGSRSCNEELQRRWQSSEDIARSDFGVGYQPAKKTSDITLRASQCWLENYVDGNEIKFDGGDSSLGQDTAWVVSSEESGLENPTSKG
ncbi:hypothetical protein HKD37_01G001857 [Glycine soja]